MLHKSCLKTVHMFTENSLAILLATHNGEKYLRELLNSLLLQSYQNFIIYISDDSSTDKTIEIIAEYCSIYKDKIIDVKNKKCFGNARDNFFYLVNVVDAPFYMFCDQDDVWEKDKIKKTLNTIKDYESIPALSYCDLSVVDENLNIINTSFRQMYPYLTQKMDWHYYIHSNDAPGCTMCLNRALVDLYKKNYLLINKENIVMHDSFFITLASLYGKIEYVDEQLIKYRQHGNNSIGAEKRNSLFYFLKKISLYSDKLAFKKMQIQIGEICKIQKKANIVLDSKLYKILVDYSCLYRQSKIKRILFMVSNNLKKKRFC